MKAIMVIGDVMLDRYTFCEVYRISPEAPVPIAKVLRDEYRLGGAANVAANVASVGYPVHLACIPSTALRTPQLVDACKRHGIHVSHDLRRVGRLPVKQRIIAQSQQMMRIDDEERMPPIDVRELERYLDETSAVIVSDYGKGSVGDCQTLTRACTDRGIPVFVDPKGRDWSRYRGAAVITPNEREAEDALMPWGNEVELTDMMAGMLCGISASNALVTRGARGVSLISSAGDRLDIPATAREVFDVTGAGDTVIAILATAYVRGYSLAAAARIANAAAGIVVGRLGAASITPEEFSLCCKSGASNG